jgi:hypothetical protein
MVVIPAQTAVVGVMIHVGFGLTVTVLLQVFGQPSRVKLSVMVKDPDAPAITVTVAVVVAPEMLPFPVMVQEWVTVPPAGVTVFVKEVVDTPHTAIGPLMLQEGVGLTTTVFEQTPGQPLREILQVSINVPEVDPEITITDPRLAGPLMVPWPVIVQA